MLSIPINRSWKCCILAPLYIVLNVPLENFRFPPHPNYDALSTENDVLVKLKFVIFNKFVCELTELAYMYLYNFIN